MNAQTLHAIAVALRDEIAQQEIRERLTRLTEGLVNRVATPAEPGPQEQISQALRELREILPAVPSNDFSPAWRKYLEEMGIADLLGRALLDRIEAIVAPVEMTTSVVRDEVQHLKDEVDRLYDAVDRTAFGMDVLHIGTEDLQPGEVELGFLIPRSAVRNELGVLGDELERLKKIVIGPFQELTTGSREEIAVRSIASSDFTILVQMDAATAAAIAKAIYGLTIAYKSFVELRKLKAKAREHGMSEEGLAPFDEHAKDVMTDAITGMTRELLEGANKLRGEGRPNEIEANLKMSLESMARRIDLGYTINVRALPPPPEPVDEGQEQTEPPAGQAHYETIQELSPELGFMRLEGEPLLGLPPGEGDGLDPGSNELDDEGSG